MAEPAAPAAPPPPPPPAPDVWARALERERLARARAESLLESKSLELYQANQALRAQHQDLQQRNSELERAHHQLQQAQARLIQSEKLASVGLLAAGVAHEINNPMAFIISNLGTMQRYSGTLSGLVRSYRTLLADASAPPADPARLAALRAQEDEAQVDELLGDIDDLVAESLEGAGRVRDIVMGLKNFSRVDAADFGEADLHAGLESTLKVVANELKYRCTIEKHYGELPLVPCNLAKLNQVFMNLLVNAAQAMAQPGTVTLRTWAEGGQAHVEVRDTGCGIPADRLGRIFDPFYTTKPVGSGTGLGLSISYGIVEEHGGRIAVQSEPGVGTAFTVSLPLKAPAPAPGQDQAQDQAQGLPASAVGGAG